MAARKGEQAVLEALKAGNTRTASAQLAGIAKSTFYEWLSDEDRTFSDAVEKAEAQAEAERVERIRKAGQGGCWTADAWWLERRRAQEWALRQRVEHSGPDGKPIETRSAVRFAEMSDSELDTYIEEQKGRADELEASTS